MNKIATRDSYASALLKLAANHNNIVVMDADLAEATRSGVFKKSYPDRFLTVVLPRPI